MSEMLKDLGWMSREYESRYKNLRQVESNLIKQLQDVRGKLDDMDKFIKDIVIIRIREEFRKQLALFRELQEEDIHKRQGCGEGLTGKKKERLEKGIKVPDSLKDDEWIMDDVEINQEWYELQLVGITNITNNFTER